MSTDTASVEALATIIGTRATLQWVHAPGDTPRATGYGPDTDCVRAAAMLRSIAAERDALRAALEAEREACAKLCEDIGDGYQAREAYQWAELKTDAQTGAQDCAAAIRARATTQKDHP